MKKIVSIFIILFGIILLTSCDGFHGTKELYFESIYSEEEVTLSFSNEVEWNPGWSHIGGAEYKTSKSKSEAIKELQSQGVTFLDDMINPNVQLIQIHNKGMWSIEFINEDKYTRVLIYEMSISIFDETDARFPFPLYGIYQDKSFYELYYLFETYDNVDRQYIIDSLEEFNQLLDVYKELDVKEDSITIKYLEYTLTLEFEGTSLTFKVS